MFSERKKAKLEKEKALAFKKLYGTTSKKEKEQRVRRIYGKNTKELAQESILRTNEWVAEKGIKLEKLPKVPHWSLVEFRPPRKPELELGNRTISVAPDSLTPRAAYVGGGKVDLEKSQTLPRRPNTVIPRLVQPMYENSRYTMRTRDPNKEMGHSRMYYKHFTDKERLQEQIDNGYTPESQPYGPAGRPVHPFEKGAGWIKPDKTFWKSQVPGGWHRKDGWNPKHDYSRSMVGEMYPHPLNASEVYTGPSGSAGDFPCMFGVRPRKKSLLRRRNRSLEKHRMFMSTMGVDSKHIFAKQSNLRAQTAPEAQNGNTNSAFKFIEKKNLLNSGGSSIVYGNDHNVDKSPISSGASKRKLYMGSLRAFSP